MWFQYVRIKEDVCENIYGTPSYLILELKNILHVGVLALSSFSRPFCLFITRKENKDDLTVFKLLTVD